MQASEIQCWLARPDEVDIETLLPQLSPDELARANRYRFPEDREAFVLAHAMRRAELARYLDRPPTQIRFGRSPKGRPVLVDTPSGDFAFSASRRRGLVVFALGNTARLGVDVEQVSHIEHPEMILSKFLDPISLAKLSGLSGLAQQAHFAQLWTITEACAKARGTGLETFSPRLEIRYDSPDFAIVQDGQNHWRCNIYAPDDLHKTTVAYAGDAWLPVQIRQWIPN